MSIPESGSHDAALENVHWEYGFDIRPGASAEEALPSEKRDPKYAGQDEAGNDNRLSPGTSPSRRPLQAID